MWASRQRERKKKRDDDPNYGGCSRRSPMTEPPPLPAATVEVKESRSFWVQPQRQGEIALAAGLG